MDHIYLEPDTLVTFDLEGSLPIFKEAYASPQAGKTVLKGLFASQAHFETLDGAHYRLLSARRDTERLNEIAYPLAHLPEKTEVLRLLTPGIAYSERNQQRPPLRFTCRFGENTYIFKRTPRLGRAFEIWDGMEISRIIQREPKSKLILDALVLERIPALFALLLPWLDNQFLN
ncbi:MAG: hypothetical protein JW934_00685 [Anaerolineae bacterium]|nr:hypothetical protein [Anaerolineae bacterium]